MDLDLSDSGPEVGSSLSTLWRSCRSAGTEETDAERLEAGPSQSASGVSRCRPCLAVQTLSGEEDKKQKEIVSVRLVVLLTERGKHCLCRFVYFNLELILQFPLNPLSYMAEGHLPLPQFWTDMQFQLGWHTEAVPSEEMVTYLMIKYLSVSHISVSLRL